MKKKKTIADQDEPYRLWFEYLRVARNSSLASVREALRHSNAFYAPWGDVMNVKFDAWWREKGYLFKEKYVVRRMAPGEPPTDPNALVIEIPLTESPTALLQRISKIVREATAKQERVSRKSKRHPTAQYRLSKGAEPKLLAVREMLTVYRDVYLKNRGLRGADLLEKTHAFYLGRKNKRWAKVPMALLFDRERGDNTVAMRNLRRYITKAERITLNVAAGIFPGRY